MHHRRLALLSTLALAAGSAAALLPATATAAQAQPPAGASTRPSAQPSAGGPVGGLVRGSVRGQAGVPVREQAPARDQALVRDQATAPARRQAQAPARGPASVRPRPAQHAAADSAGERRQVVRYWTEARMEAAEPLNPPNPAKGAKLSPADVRAPSAAAAPSTAAPTAPAPSAVAPTALPASSAAPALQAARSGGAAWTGGGAVVRTTGRIFFTTQGRNASCSGSAVTSANKSVVITAGHCVKLNGAFHTNWVFVPGYDRGARPYGTWAATKLLTTPQWDASEDVDHDMAAAVVAPLDGRSLVDVVGGQGVAFNQPRRRQMYAFGYPAAAPYDGSKLVYCSGRAFDDYLLSNDLGLTCDQTGGASGGPWMLAFDESTGLGTLNSVNSFKYGFAPNWMFGPYFGNEAQAVYQSAQTTGVL
ncbi:trypsin-like serine peptidase [Nonomuraea wenchangensis]|uniref:trypsin-like serine peptidase n=1 Tax=Nonomuraea wenchangensis TaxID=568860 RepID=UPI0033216349